MKNEDGLVIFPQSEADVLVERLGAPEVLTQLEIVAVYDLPKLSVTKRVGAPGAAPRYVPRDFKRLSLGQQQSVLLALTLASESSTSRRGSTGG